MKFEQIVKKVACVVMMLLALMVMLPEHANAQGCDTVRFQLTPEHPEADVELIVDTPLKVLDCYNKGEVEKTVTDNNCAFDLTIPAGEVASQQKICETGGFITDFFMSPTSGGDVLCRFLQCG